MSAGMKNIKKDKKYLDKIVNKTVTASDETQGGGALTRVIRILDHSFGRPREVEDDQLGVVAPAHDGFVQLDSGVHSSNVCILPEIIQIDLRTFTHLTVWTLDKMIYTGNINLSDQINVNSRRTHPQIHGKCRM